MKEKLSKGENERSLLGIKIGVGIFLIGFVSLLAGVLLPVTMEYYFGMIFSISMLCGLIVFLIVGIRDIIKLYSIKKFNSSNARIEIIGVILLIISMLLMILGLNIESSLSLSSYGNILAFISIVLIIFSVVKSAKEK